MKCAFGCAETLYLKHLHPRLLVGPDELSGLRGRIRSGHARRIMQALRRKVTGLVDAIESTDDLPRLVAHHTVCRDPMGGHVLSGLGDIALVAVLDDDSRASEAARRALCSIPAAEKLGPVDTYSAGYSSWGNLQMTYDLIHAYLSEDERASMARWMSQASVKRTLKMLPRSNYLKSAGANTPMAGMMSALLSLLAVEGDAGAGDLSKQRTQLLEYFEASLSAMMGRNGYPFEDIGYGSGMVSLLARIVEATRRAGLYDAYVQCPRYARFGQAMLHFVQPWGKVLSNTGDYGADFGWRSIVFPRLAKETHDPTLLWLHGTLSYPIACSGPMDMKQRLIGFPELKLKNGFQVPVDLYSLLTADDLARPVHPRNTRCATQYHDPDRGIATFRSSWREDATFVVFDGAQRSCAAQGHDHDSGGHFSLSALGECFAIDTGRYNIEQDQHNVVLVDGKSGQSTNGEWRATHYQATMTEYCPGEFVDYAAVNNSQMSNCYWSFRHLGLVKGRFAPGYVWMVEDVNFANDYREFWWTLNTHPDNKIMLAKDRATVVGCRHGHCLDVFFGLPGPSEYPKPHRLRLARHVQLGGSRGYMGDRVKLARDYKRTVGNAEYGPVFIRPRLIGKVRGYNGRFMALMIPRMKGQDVPQVRRLPSPPASLAMQIEFAKVTDTVIWAYEHRILEAVDIRARGHWVVVRRSRNTGRVLAHAMGDGTMLQCGPQTIVPCSSGQT